MCSSDLVQLAHQHDDGHPVDQATHESAAQGVRGAPGYSSESGILFLVETGHREASSLRGSWGPAGCPMRDGRPRAETAAGGSLTDTLGGQIGQ